MGLALLSISKQLVSNKFPHLMGRGMMHVNSHLHLQASLSIVIIGEA
jgi:hypothetical protein